jgi:hypothetical protein
VSRVYPAFFGLLCAAGLAGPAFGCGSTSGDVIVEPITGVTVLADTVTAGHGCGTGVTQIFKYAVVALGRTDATKVDTVLGGTVYDCFTDAQFVNLPQSAGSFDYELQIYAYNQAAYLAAIGGDDVAFANRVAAGPSPDGGEPLSATNPTFTTICTGTEIDQVQVLAVCDPLKPGSAGVEGGAAADATVELPTGTFPAPDGGTYVCDNEYASVQYRVDVGSSIGTVAQSRCNVLTGTGVQPFVIAVSPAVAPASYTINVGLLRADGTLLGQTTCGADVSPGQKSFATCKPVE